ncbi:MAG TPA: dTDP-4-dehydrorhamnose reductase [Chitinispirillaceae bacterium]|nr:dTDP-4-dehydrorhamnose reductase [Chitinispirillaceae bacterium]
MKKQSLLIIGSKGQLGTDMVLLSKQAGYNVSEIDFPDIDITDPQMTQQCILKFKPDFIINCAAYTAVDNCETHQQQAFAVNAKGVQNIAVSAKKIDAVLIHISTDYVFDGKKTSPYLEDDKASPQTVYGKSKLEGEELIASHCDKFQIFRIAWLYGIHGNNFVKTIRSIAHKKMLENQPLTVVNDQFGTPTYTREVCAQVLKMIDQPHYGIFHSTNEGFCTWYDFASEIVKAAGIDVQLLPCTTEAFPRPAPRPLYSVLENAHLKKLDLNIMKNWKEAFQSFLIDELKCK